MGEGNGMGGEARRGGERRGEWRSGEERRGEENEASQGQARRDEARVGVGFSSNSLKKMIVRGASKGTGHFRKQVSREV